TISTRTVLRTLGLVTAFAGLLYLLFQIRGVLTSILIAGFLALALNPAVVLLERRLRLGRAAAALIVFGGTVIGLLAIFAAVLTPLYSQVLDFASNLPTNVRHLTDIAPLRENPEIRDRIDDAVKQLPERLPATAGALLGLAGTVSQAVLTTITILFLT